MKVKGLIRILDQLDKDKEIVISSDEELNTLYKRFEVSELEEIKGYVIWGYSGSELE